MLQSVLMSPQDLRSGLYAPLASLISPLFAKSSTVGYFKLAYVFSI